MAETYASLAASLSDRYAIDRELGRGGMATVYLAQDKKHDRKVAIKVLRRELAASLGAERFLREIQIAARLAHPHILPLIDSGEAHGALYYVTPHVPDGSLRPRMERERRRPLEQASGEQDLGGRSDLYSLACVVYEMLAGEPPLRGGGARATMAKQVTETPRPLRAVRPDAPARVERVLARALAKNPAERFATVA